MIKSSLVSLVILSVSLGLISSGTASAQTEKGSDRLLAAVSWYQNSAEMTALYYQGFNIARLRVDEAIASRKGVKPMAVVVDIDETMLDNSPFETTVIREGESRKGWSSWTEKAAAKALPGALEFAKYAESKHVEIFYVTNRDNEERTSTLKNLQITGFPYAQEDHLLTRGDTSFSTGSTSSKEGRRMKVASTHEIILLMGDNLNDFSNVFEDRDKNYGKDAVIAHQEDFGKKFIVLPNPMYGAWEKPLIDNKHGLTDQQKSELMRQKLVPESSGK